MKKIGERIRVIIDWDEKLSRSPFALLEKITGINRNKWQNFHRAVQRPTEEIIEEACKLWPNYALWIATGNIDPPNHIHPWHATTEIETSKNDILLKRDTDSGIGTVSIPHALKLKNPKSPEPLTSDDFDWGYFGAGPCELAANVLFHFEVSAEIAKDSRTKFARDIISKLNREKDVLRANTAREWIQKNINDNQKD